ncbi:hypothetical protein [Planococcus rifietoensis]|uniref:hypothetical protein n=1 Tax=Planococcus rifietoensis TaxID=200991 RepID=UPI00384B213C
MEQNNGAFFQVSNIKNLEFKDNKATSPETRPMLYADNVEIAKIDSNDIVILSDKVKQDEMQKLISDQVKVALKEIEQMKDPKDVHEYLQSLGALGTLISTGLSVIGG